MTFYDDVIRRLDENAAATERLTAAIDELWLTLIKEKMDDANAHLAELTRLVDRGLLAVPRDEPAEARPALDQPVRFEKLKRLLHRVAGDVELVRQEADVQARAGR